MVNEITKTTSYKVENSELRYNISFEDKNAAEKADIFLDALVKVLKYLRVDLSDKDKSVRIIKAGNNLYFEGVEVISTLSPDWEGHHPDGGITFSLISNSVYLDSIVKKAFLEKVKKANHLSNDWDSFVEVYPYSLTVFRNNKKLEVVRDCHYISIAGVKLFDFI